MTKRTRVLLLLVGALAFAGAPLVGCGPTTDPSAGGNGTSTSGGGNTSYTNTNNTSNGSSTSTGTSTGNGTGGTTGTSTGSTSTNNGSGTGTGTGTGTPTVCTENTTFYGQIGGSKSHDGGTWTTTPLTNDAGLQAVFNAIKVSAVKDNPATPANEALQTLSPPLQVTKALVIATSYAGKAGKPDKGNQNFWVADKNQVVQVYLAAPLAAPTVVKVGQQVSFEVDGVEDYSGTPQVSVIKNFKVDSPSNPVPYIEVGSNPMTVSADYGRVVRVFGKVQGAGTACGGTSKCYTLAYGTGGTQTVAFRSSSTDIKTGDCITFVGPTTAYPDVKDAAHKTPKLQLDTVNFSWYIDANSSHGGTGTGSTLTTTGSGTGTGTGG